jgi:hypothetical protein
MVRFETPSTAPVHVLGERDVKIPYLKVGIKKIDVQYGTLVQYVQYFEVFSVVENPGRKDSFFFFLYLQNIHD